MTTNKPRLDELLVDQGFFNERPEALRAVLAGRVLNGDTVLRQPGLRIDPKTPLTVRQDKSFVSRGGEKLAKALEVFPISPQGLRCIDIGASTGGFTDCLLKHGAAEVCAVDVGYGQLAWELRKDPRVRLFERTNINTVDLGALGAPFDLLVIDVSFTRVGRLVKILEDLLVDQGHCIALIKPQFELPKSLVSDGVSVEQELHIQAVESVTGILAQSLLKPQGLIFSPLQGAKGNIEFLLWAQKMGDDATIFITEVVEEAHRHFGHP